MPPPLSCELCDRSFTKRYSLNRHLHSIHNVVPLKVPRKAILCPVKSCSDTFAYHGSLRSHLKSVHNVQLQGQKLTFTSMQDFFEWKKEEESKSFVKYVKACGVQRLLDNTEVYRFNCHRTGTYIPEGKGIRKLKSQGSCKIGASCPSTITAHRHPNNTVTCMYCLTHVGHDIVGDEGSDGADEGDESVPEASDEQQVIKIIYPAAITDIIAANVPQSTNIVSMVPKLTTALVQNHEVFNRFKFSDEDQIILSIILAQGNATGEMLESIQKASKKVFVDNLNELNGKIENVKQLSVIRKMEIQPDFIQYLDKLPEIEPDLVLICQHLVGDCDGQSAGDNYLVQNALQRHLLQKLGNSGVICIDTVRYEAFLDYIILFIFVLNQDLSWNLCGFCLCSEMSLDNMSVVLTQIRSRTGPIVPNVLLSQPDEIICQAWSDVMGQCGQHLFCQWHLDEMFQSKLRHTLADNVGVACIYKQLLEILECRNEQKFNELAESVLANTSTDVHLEEFGKFFQNNILLKREKCSKYVRSEYVNMATSLMEPIHYAMEQLFSDKGGNWGQSLCCVFLFFYQQNLAMHNKDVLVSVFSDNSESEHNASLFVSKDIVACITEKQWNIFDGQGKYTVEKLQCCSAQCQLKCVSCNVCPHAFSCSCISSTLCWKLCRHIHKVGQYILSEQLDNECELIVDVKGESDECATVSIENCAESGQTEDESKSDAEHLQSCLQKCSLKILSNAKLVRNLSDLRKLKSSLESVLRLSEGMMRESTSEIGIQCDETMAKFSDVSRPAYLEDHDYLTF